MDQLMTRSRPAKAWIFDVDGVLVDLETKQTEQNLMQLLVRIVHHGDLLAFNSGRSPSSILEHILSHIEQRIDTQQRRCVIAVGEKGGAWGTYAADGTFQVTYDSAITVPPLLRTIIQTLVETSNLFDVLELQEKQTMLSLVKRPRIALALFAQVQERLTQQIRQCLANLRLTNWKVDTVSDAIEIEHVSAGKDKGAQKILNYWLQNQEIQIQRIQAFGDSRSDVAMATAIHQHQQFPVTFVYTGMQNLQANEHPFQIICTSAKYVQGTLEYLESFGSSDEPITHGGESHGYC